MAKTTKKKSTTTRKASTPVPPGLAAAFKLIQPDDASAAWARAQATDTYPHALAFLAALETDGSIDDVIARATQEEHGHVLEGADADNAEWVANLTGDTALHVGFAACWLLMTQINGGAR